MPPFAELLATPGVVEVSELRNRFGLMAFHGGNLERGTDRIAEAAAARAGASLYVVRQPPDLRWHIPSAAIDPAVSPALAAFLAHVHVAVALHGYGRDRYWTTLLVGGSNRVLAGCLAGELRARLTGYEVCDDLAIIPVALRGVHPHNPVNRPRGGGVQLELPPRIRGQTPRSDPAHEAAVIEALAATARDSAAGEAIAAIPRHRGGPPARLNAIRAVTGTGG